MHDGVAIEDVLTLEDEEPPAGAQPLLHTVMSKGRRTARPSLAESRERCRRLVGELPTGVRRLIDGRKYQVRIRIDS
jgi:nicotinate phosphoribosyltransferase